jgi:cytochrome c peroxidase
MRISLLSITLAAAVSMFGCQQETTNEAGSTADANPSPTASPDVGVADAESITESEAGSATANEAKKPESEQHEHGGPGMGRGRGRMGRGPGGMGGNREDMVTLHALFDGRDKITRTIKNLPDGAETLTESDDDEIAGLIQEHVPAMDIRVNEDKPLPPMTFHPLFVAIIKHADKIAMKYESTDHGLKVTYTSKEPYVVLLIQEHAKLVSRFIKNGMEEIHKPYTIPKLKGNATPKSEPAKNSALNNLEGDWRSLPTAVTAPKDNPTTTAKVALGKKLFFDPRLSLTGTVSCNTCHNVMEGGDDGRPTSMGILGRIGPRNAPTVWNSAFQASQFWDGRSPSLEDQAKGPLVATPEMGMPTHAFVVDRLRTLPGYVAEFKAVFKDEDALSIDNVAKAIAAFERTLITPNSPYDRYVSGTVSALSDSQVRGMKLFDSVGCIECHSGPAFNGWDSESTIPTFQKFPRSMENPYVTKYDLATDTGRFAVTKNENDRNHFKVATLRNVTLTAPYFHNGTVESLPDAVRVMAATQLDEKLTEENFADIVSFLSALEGEFPEITLPRIPSRSGETILKDQEPANTGH